MAKITACGVFADTRRNLVIVNNVTYELYPMEVRLLALLMMEPGVLRSVERIARAMGKRSQNVINSMSRIRQALGDPTIVRTIEGTGFCAFGDPPGITITADEISLYPELRVGYFFGKRVEISRMQGKLLRSLLERVGEVVSHRDLLVGVWGAGASKANSKRLSGLVRELLEKLEKIGVADRVVVENLVGEGYKVTIIDV